VKTPASSTGDSSGKPYFSPTYKHRQEHKGKQESNDASLSMNHVIHTILRQFSLWVKPKAFILAEASAFAAQSPCNHIVGAL